MPQISIDVKNQMGKETPRKTSNSTAYFFVNVTEVFINRGLIILIFYRSPDVEAEESEAARAARLEIVSALKSRKMAMDEKLSAKMEELKKLCLQEAQLSGQLPPEYPLLPGEAPPAIRRRVGTSFSLPENLLNKAKSSKVIFDTSIQLLCSAWILPEMKHHLIDLSLNFSNCLLTLLVLFSIEGGVAGSVGTGVRNPAEDHFGGAEAGHRQYALESRATPAQDALSAKSPAAQGSHRRIS